MLNILKYIFLSRFQYFHFHKIELYQKSQLLPLDYAIYVVELSLYELNIKYLFPPKHLNILDLSQSIAQIILWLRDIICSPLKSNLNSKN